MTRILALDPGGTTGWALFRLPDDDPIYLIDCGQVVGGNDRFIRWWGTVEHDLVVSETFRLDGRTRYPDITPLRIEGALDVLSPGWHGQANVMKAHAPDDLLKKHGLWIRGQRHSRDAIRHGLAYAKMHKHLPTLAKFWPERP